MKIIAYDNFKAGVSLDDLKPYLRDEVSNVWRLWKAGIVRENYARADVGGVILSRAADHDVDLVVMGLYGHSRLREMVLGGASRTLLSSMTVPLFLSH